MNFLLFFIGLGFFLFARYFAVAGGFYWYFWRMRGKDYETRRVQKTPYIKGQFARELRNSWMSSMVFGFLLAIPLYESFRPYSQIYVNPLEHGFVWLVISVPCLIFVHDTYFYWMHRLIHGRRLFKAFHRVHHESYQPSPFTAYSFHPLEAFLEYLWILPVIFVVPLNVSSLAVFSIFSIVANVNAHSGIEIYPERWRTKWFFKYLNTATVHDSHHRTARGNYGLYFLLWDHWMNTLSSNK